MDPNPYEAPHATLQMTDSFDDSGFLREPRDVPAGNAVEWFSTGWTWVMQAPGTWIGLFVLMLLGVVVASCVPFATNLLMPVVTAGIAIGCERQRRGEELTVDCLFDGFRSPHVMQLVLVGVFTMLATFLVMIAVFPFLFGAIALVGSVADQNEPAAGVAIFVVMFLLIAAAVVPIMLATFFAPMLVVFHGIPALEAMQLSLRAGWRNLGAMLVWLLIGTAISVATALTLFIGMLIAAPLFMATNYAAYRDIFYAKP